MKARLAPILLTLPFATAAFASESTNYSITPESQASGGRSTSTHYTLDTAADAGGTATSTAYTLRCGFAGSLYDPAALEISASPLTVNETSTRQLDPSLVLDDSSRLALAPVEVSWSVVHGPLTGISAAGIATAGTVYQNTGATAAGTYGSFADSVLLDVLNVGSDNFGTYAGDGIDDDWQVLYFGEDNPAAGPARDSDGDHQDNLFEFTAGLIPTDSTSFFHLAIQPVAGQPGQKQLVFSPRLEGRTYRVLTSSALEGEGWEDLTGAVVTDLGTQRSVTDTGATAKRKFYQVEITKP
jgi:hypothetical protein